MEDIQKKYFEETLLNDNILDALYDMRFDACTPIQAACIDPIIEGMDIMGVAQTGTGKTAAYLLPVLSRLDDGGYPEDAVNCLIMAPTRELFAHISHPYTRALMSAIPKADPDEEKERIVLEGDIPSAIDLPEGCSFASRCFACTEECRKRRPELKNLGNGHFAACHHTG